MHLFPCRQAALVSTYCHIYTVIRTGVAPAYFVYITLQGQRIQAKKGKLKKTVNSLESITKCLRVNRVHFTTFEFCKAIVYSNYAFIHNVT